MRITLSRATALAAAMAILAASRIAGFPWEAAALVWGVSLWRVLSGGNGRALVGPRVRQVLAGVLALLGGGLLYALAVEQGNPLVLLLTVLAIVQVFLLLGVQVPFVTFLLLLFSSIHVSGAAMLHADVVTLLCLAAWGVLLAWSLVLFERHTVGRRPLRVRGAVRQVVVGSYDTLPRGAVRTTVFGLCACGFAFGLLLYVLLPRPTPSQEGPEETAAGRDDGAPFGNEVGVSPDAEDWVTGPVESSKGLRLGDVGRIKQDLTPYFEVRLPPGRAPRLRELTYDLYHRGAWTSSEEGPEVRGVEALRTESGQGGWISLGRQDDFYRGFGVRIAVYRGPQRRLYLERDAVRVRILRGGKALVTVLRRQDSEQTDSFVELQVGDVIEERAVPPIRDPNALEAARSDAFIAPRDTYVHLPPECESLRAVARGIVGNETNPWRRARLLEQWLESDVFTYTLEMPPVRLDRPIVDFVERTRRGHCEYFAGAMTLLLRALGHPARAVRGFRGGDWLEDRGTWMVRGMHYHLWTEMYLHGIGWTPIDATPPDDQAADAKEVVTQAADTVSQPEQDASLAQRFLGYGDEQRRALAGAIAGFFDRFVLGPLRFLFGPDGFYAGWGVLAIGLVLLLRRRREVRIAAAVGVPRRNMPEGPYGRALTMLAKKGWRRRRPQTAREFERAVTQFLPDAASSLHHLTRLYERDRFGARPPTGEELARARDEVGRLADVVDRRRAKGR